MPLVSPGQDIAGYHIETAVGKGGMGEIWLAKQTSIGREVALKILSPTLVAKDPRFAERFIAEAQAAGRLNHPNIIAVHDVGQVPVGQQVVHYFSMEFVDGENFREIIDREGPINEDLIGEVMKAMADGLCYAHNLGMIHRDIKPDNIMMTHDGRFKLADFGLAMQADDEDQEVDRDERGRVKVMGTPLYMSPEQARGQTLTVQSDQYSLGATLYTLLTAEYPYKRGNAKEVMRAHVRDPVPDPHDEIDCSPGWRRLCIRLMAKRPEERFATPEDLCHAIDGVIAGTWPPRRSRRASATENEAGGGNIGLVVGLIAAAVLVLGILGFVLFSGGDETPTNTDDDTAPGVDNAQIAVKSTRSFLERLPKDPQQALQHIAERLKNPYYADNAEAKALLEARAQEINDILSGQQAAREQASNERLAAVSEAIAGGQLHDARKLLAACTDFDRSFAAVRLDELQSQLEQLERDHIASATKAIAAAVSDTALQEVLDVAELRQISAAGMQELDKLVIQRKQTLAEAADAETRRRADEDRKNWQTLADKIHAARGQLEGNDDRHPTQYSQIIRACGEATRQLHEVKLIEMARQLSTMANRARETQESLRSWLDKDPYTLDMTFDGKERRVQVVSLHEFGPTIRSGKGTLAAAWTDTDLPAVEIIEEGLIASGLTNVSVRTATFLWLCRHPDAFALLMAEEDDPQTEALAAIDPDLARARLRLAQQFDLSSESPFVGEDLQTTPSGLRWQPAKILPFTGKDAGSGAQQLLDEHTQAVVWDLGLVAEAEIGCTIQLTDLTALIGLRRDGHTRRLVLHEPFQKIGLLDSTPEQQMQFTKRESRRGIWHKPVVITISLAQDGEVGFTVNGQALIPDSGDNKLPGQGPVQVVLESLRFKPMANQQAREPALLLQDLKLSGWLSEK